MKKRRRKDFESKIWSSGIQLAMLGVLVLTPTGTRIHRCSMGKHTMATPYEWKAFDSVPVWDFERTKLLFRATSLRSLIGSANLFLDDAPRPEY